MMWLGYYLASRGYIVAAVNHHGNTAAEKERAAQGFLLYWERETVHQRVSQLAFEFFEQGWANK
jgi:predicted dienelactone hydrolase